MPAISAGIVSLILAYVLSQFYRAFIAVLTPVLRDQLGVTPGDLAVSSGLWFLAFAATQLPVGSMLDRIGPRRTVALFLGIGAGLGAVIFALAQVPWHLHVAMTLLGIGCGPALMGSYYIFAREYPPARFGALAGMVVGLGSLGDILGTTPLVWMTHLVGWRASLWIMAGFTLAVAALIWNTVKDPVQLQGDHPKGSIGAVLRIRALWFLLPLFFICYAVSAAVRGLWAAPFLEEVYHASALTIGHATLAMGLAMIAGNLLVIPITRLFGGVRRSVLALGFLTIGALGTLVLRSDSSLTLAMAMLAILGFSGATYAVVMAHGRSFLPAHLVGRGVTFLNMVSVGGVGVMQFASRPVYGAASAAYPPATAFAMLFLFFLIPLTVGLLLYFLTPEAENG